MNFPRKNCKIDDQLTHNLPVTIVEFCIFPVFVCIFSCETRKIQDDFPQFTHFLFTNGKIRVK